MVELLLILAAAAAAAAALAGLGYLLVWFLLHGRRDGPGLGKAGGLSVRPPGPPRPRRAGELLAAFRRAAEAGYGAELDVHLTADGYLAVIHDSDLARMCGVEGRVEDLTALELGKLRLAGSGEPIPFLEQVLPLFEGRGPLVVELKTAGGNHAALCARTLECLDRFRADYCIESFDPRCLLWLRQNRPEAAGQLTQDFLRHGEAQPLRNRLTLTAMLCNGLTKPDFVACRYQDRGMLPLRCGGCGADGPPCGPSTRPAN